MCGSKLYQLKNYAGEKEVAFYVPSSMQLFTCEKDKAKDAEENFKSEEDAIPVMGLDQPGKKVVINMANTCNLKCKYCFADHGTYQREVRATLSASAATKIIKELKSEDKPLGKVIFFGGEPLLNYKQMKKICENLAFKTENFYMVTNGTILNDEVVQLIKNYKIITTISYDGVNDINDLHRGDGTASKVDNFIGTLLGSGIPKKQIAILCVYTPKHIEAGYSHEGVKKQIEKKYPGVEVIIQDVDGRAAKLGQQFIFTNENIEEFNQKFFTEVEENLKLEDQIWLPEVYRIVRTFLMKERTNVFCNDLSKDTMAYDYDGKKYICQMFWGEKDFELKNSEPYSDLTEYLNSKNNYDECQSCFAKDYCSDCIKGMNVLKKEDVKTVKLRQCDFVKKISDLVLSRLTEILADDERLAALKKQFIKNVDYYTNTYYA